MKALISTIIALTGVLALPFFSGRTYDDLPGVKGKIIRLEKNKQNANQADKITAKVRNIIEIDWAYIVVPGSIPTAASAKADGESAKLLEIRDIERPKLGGGGILGAFFTAEKEGKSTLTFEIKSVDTNGEETSVVLKLEVNVIK
jgi:hypothetical protein